MDTPLPVKTVVLFVACGTLAVIILCICSKRQITRFALKSSKGPHTSIGHDAPKSLRREIERRLRRVGDIKYEPRLMSEEKESALLSGTSIENCHFFYRMKAVDSLELLYEELKKYSESIRYCAGQNLRVFLLELRQSGPLDSVKVDTIEHFSEAVDHARHNPAEFGEIQYDEFMELLNEIVEHIRNNRNKERILNTEEIVLKAEPILPGGGKPQQKTWLKASPEIGSDKEAPSITYRPALRGSGAGVVCMTPRSNSGSSQAEMASSDSRSDQSSCPSSRSSGNFETSV